MSISRAGIYAFKHTNLLTGFCPKMRLICKAPFKYPLAKNVEGVRYAPEFACKKNTGIESTQLDPTSTACKFFGVADPKKLYGEMATLMNHYNLSTLYEKKGISTVAGDNKNEISSSFFEERWNRVLKTRCTFWDMLTGKYSNGKDIIAGKITFSHGYELNGKEVPHSIGIVKHKNNLYIIDSLGDENIENALTHREWVTQIKSHIRHILGEEPPKIIFNWTPQQTTSELTCNNWTYANIENLINALKSGKEINSGLELDRILPKNINRILQRQMEQVIEFTQ